MDQKIKERKDVSLEERWSVEAMYRDWSEWQKDFDKTANPGKSPRFPELSASQFNLLKIEDVKRLFDLFMNLEQKLGFIATFARLKHDEDVAEEMAKKAYSLGSQAFHALREETSWIEPALLQLPLEVLQNYQESEALKTYHVLLRKMVRLKPHTLDAQGEMLLAFSGKVLETSQRVFSSLNNADLKFPSCKDEKGQSHELTHGTYHLYLKAADRTLRKEAFLNLHETFGKYENTLCELIQGQVQNAVFEAKARNYSSCLKAALYPNQIDIEVYTSLIQSTKSYLPLLHRYLGFRKKQLGYSDLHLYDLNVSLVKDVEIRMKYDEAVENILDSVSVLGEGYKSILRKGLIEDRWVDRYENTRKRSGAYSSGCYGSRPYILMNYHETLQDVMTLAHEAGHSMHSYYSMKHQPYQDAKYSIFVAEVASTFHEELLFQFLLKTSKTKEERAFLINQKIDGIRSTFFRQVLFAEFELQLHLWVEAGMPLTPALLKEHYLKLTCEYLGDSVEIDPSVAWEWSRIPHFYSSFYVYQYATGISAASALARNVLEGKSGACEKYLEFISAGSSLDPLSVLQRAGVDMKSEAPVRSLMKYFEELIDKLEETLEKK